MKITKEVALRKEALAQIVAEHFARQTPDVVVRVRWSGFEYNRKPVPEAGRMSLVLIVEETDIEDLEDGNYYGDEPLAVIPELPKQEAKPSKTAKSNGKEAD